MWQNVTKGANDECIQWKTYHPNPVIGIASKNAAVIINILIVNECFFLCWPSLRRVGATARSLRRVVSYEILIPSK